jgi:hypothetical protein
MAWTRLFKRVFNVDIVLRACGSELIPIAIIKEHSIIEKLLKHIGFNP